MKCKDGGICGIGGFCKECPALGASDSSALLDGKIQGARENLERIVSKFNGSENHKQIRMLRKRILKKLLKEQVGGMPPN